MGARKREMCSDSRYILMVEPTRFADRFHVVKEKQVRENSKVYGLSLRKRYTCHFLKWGSLEDYVQGEKIEVRSPKYLI